MSVHSILSSKVMWYRSLWNDILTLSALRCYVAAFQWEVISESVSCSLAWNNEVTAWVDLQKNGLMFGTFSPLVVDNSIVFSIVFCFSLSRLDLFSQVYLNCSSCHYTVKSSPFPPSLVWLVVCVCEPIGRSWRRNSRTKHPPLFVHWSCFPFNCFFSSRLIPLWFNSIVLLLILILSSLFLCSCCFSLFPFFAYCLRYGDGAWWVGTFLLCAMPLVMLLFLLLFAFLWLVCM